MSFNRQDAIEKAYTLKKRIHRLKHFFGYRGHVWGCIQGDYLWIGFQCIECKEVNGLHRVRSLKE